MKVELVGVSQGVSFEHGPKARNFLDFRIESGRQFRIAVEEEAFNEVLAAVYGDGSEGQQPEIEENLGEIYPPSPDADPDAVEFGGDSHPDQGVEQELLQQEQQAADNFVRDLETDGAPTSEDEVPSL